MTQPRIGTTVHYVPRTAKPRCDTASVIAMPHGPAALNCTLLVTHSASGRYTTYNTQHDPNPDQRTPGYWHHIH